MPSDYRPADLAGLPFPTIVVLTQHVLNDAAREPETVGREKVGAGGFRAKHSDQDSQLRVSRRTHNLHQSRKLYIPLIQPAPNLYV